MRPTVLHHSHDAISHDYVAGEPGLLDVSGAMKLLAWNDGSLVTTIAAGDTGLAKNYQFFHRNTLFWAADGSGINKQKVSTDLSAAMDLVGFGNDTTSGAADLGTDGNQLVWMEGYGRAQPSGVYPSTAAMVSPYTTDSAQIQKRVLRTDLSPYPFGTSPFVVGCGYAARTTERVVNGQNAAGTMLLRLADGALWFLPSGSTIDWAWQQPLAVNCDELFVKVREKPAPGALQRTNVARVRIDSLGAPTMP